MKKRTLSLLLCIVMMLSLLPTVAFADSPINGVAVTDVQTPVLNASCSTSGITVTTAPNADAFKNSFTRWAKKVTDDEVWHFRLYDEPYKNMTESDTFEEGTYRLFLDVGIKDEYSFSDGCETTINGETATSILADSDQFIIIWSKEYSVTAPAAPTAITEVSIEGLKVPAAGDDIAAWLSSITYSNAEAYKYITPQVFEGTHGDSEYTGKSEGVFSADKEYFFYVELAPNDGYVFDKDKLTVSMADISEMGHDLRSGGAKLNVASDYFTPTEPVACEVTRVDITVDEPVLGMTPDNMFDSVSIVAYDKDGNEVTELSLEGSEAFCCATFSKDVLGIWSGSIEDASWYYGLGLYLVGLGATMAKDVQVTVNGSDSSILDAGVCDEIDILFPVFAMPVKTAPVACEVARIDLTVDEPALGMTHLQMFESLSLIAYDKDGNVVEHIGIDGYDAFSYATFALSAMDHWDDAIADASKYYGLAPYIGTDAGVTIAKDVQVTVNGSSSSILEVNIWDDESQNVVVNFAMPVKAAPSYSIIAGANGEWTKGDMSAYLVVSDAPFAKFKNVKVDGAVIAGTNYVAFEGSTKVALAPEYLETLSEGVHSIEIVSSDGSASTNFTVKVAPVTTGTITISKTFMDIDEDDCPINTATFTVTSNDGTYNKTAKVGDRDFAPNPAAGQFVWELNDVPAGTYTVTETAYNVDGYTCTVTYKVGTGDEQEGDSATAALAAGEDLVFTFVDTYVKDVTVTFEMNGHGTQVPAQTFASGEKAAKPADPAASGYTFDGWYADAAFSAAFDFNTAINADTTVYAKWTEKTPPSDPSSPQTGDNNQLFLWAALLFVSGGTLAVTSVYDKKRRSIVK